MKKIIFKILQWSFLLAYLIIALSFTNSKRNSIISESISIKVLGKHDFLNYEIVENLLNENKIFLDHYKAHVSSGTYVRSLVNDMGNTLGCGATVLSIKRTRVGDYQIKNSLQF